MKFATYAFTILLSFTAGTLSSGTAPTDQNSSLGAMQSNSAPFRDGLYLGRLAAKQGKQPHVSAGRWNSEGDRDAFTSGYAQGFSQPGA